MNKIYESETMTVHDDREPLHIIEALRILMAGKAIRICEPPNYSAEDELDIYDDDYEITLADIIPSDLLLLPKHEVYQAAYNYISGYELYKC